MGYVGNKPALNYTTFAVQHFTTSATTGYTLDNAVTNENDIRLVINNVVQQPGGSYAYTASGTTLTLSAATTSSDTMYCVFLGKAVQTVNPGAGSVGTSQLATDAVTQVKMADDSVGTAEILDTNVTGAKLNDDVISGQGALGAAPADTDEFLVSDAGTLKRVDYSYIKGITQSSFVPIDKPLVINGNMAVAQRATTSAGVTSGSWETVDRWTHYLTTAGTWTITQDTASAPTDEGFGYATKWDNTTANASLSADSRLFLDYIFEGQDLQMFKKGTANAEKFTLAFWVNSTKTGTFIAELFDSNSRTCSQSYTVDTTNTWEKKVINFPADTSGTLPNTNARGLEIYLWFAAGTNYTSGTLNETWAANVNANRAVGQVNCADSTSNNFLVTGVQMEVGEYTSADLPPFRHESYGDNLQRCQRYCYKQVSGSSLPVCSGQMWTTGIFVGNLDFPVTMRAVPTVAAVNGTNYWKILSGGSEDSCDAYSINRVGTTGSAIEIQTNLSVSTAGYAAHARTAHASAEAIFEAEL